MTKPKQYDSLKSFLDSKHMDFEVLALGAGLSFDAAHNTCLHSKHLSTMFMNRCPLNGATRGR